MYNILRKSSWKFSQTIVTRCIASLSEIQSNRQKLKEALIESYKFTDQQTNQLFSRNQMLQHLPVEQVIKSVAMIQQLKFTSKALPSQPSYALILHQPAHTLKYQYETLLEVGFNKITLCTIKAFLAIMSRPINDAYKQQWLSPHSNIVENIFRVADAPSNMIEAVPYSESDTLQMVHTAAIKKYATKRLQIVSSKGFVGQRSLSSIESTVKIVEANITNHLDKISETVFRFNPDELNELLDLRYVDFRRIVVRGKLSRINWKTHSGKLKYIDELMEKYGIGDYAVANYPNIVRMDCGLLHRQFNRISKLSNARRLFEHPFIIRLVLRMSTFDDYALANGQCFDDIFDETFAEYFLNEFAQKYMRSNILWYLSYRLNRTNDEIVSHLYENPQASRGRIHIIHDTLQFLLHEGYSADDIFSCLHIVLLPSNDVRQALQELEDERKADSNTKPLGKTAAFQLCVLSILRKYNYDYKNITSDFDDRLAGSPEMILELKAFIQNALRGKQF